MNTNERQLQEQQAPDKNTDNAFVKVGSDGHPVIPQTAENASEDERNTDVQSNGNPKNKQS